MSKISFILERNRIKRNKNKNSKIQGSSRQVKIHMEITTQHNFKEELLQSRGRIYFINGSETWNLTKNMRKSSMPLTQEF